MALYDYRRKIILTCILTRTTKQLKQKQQQTRNKRKCIGKHFVIVYIKKAVLNTDYFYVNLSVRYDEGNRD